MNGIEPKFLCQIVWKSRYKQKTYLRMINSKYPISYLLIFSTRQLVTTYYYKFRNWTRLSSKTYFLSHDPSQAKLPLQKLGEFCKLANIWDGWTKFQKHITYKNVWCFAGLNPFFFCIGWRSWGVLRYRMNSIWKSGRIETSHAKKW